MIKVVPGGAPFWGPGPNPTGALKVGVKTLLRSRKGSREAGLHVGSRGACRVTRGGRVSSAIRGGESSRDLRFRGFPHTWGWASHPLTPRRVH